MCNDLPTKEEFKYNETFRAFPKEMAQYASILLQMIEVSNPTHFSCGGKCIRVLIFCGANKRGAVLTRRQVSSNCFKGDP